MNKFERAMLENQVVFAEELWLLLREQGLKEAMTDVALRIVATRLMIEEDDKEEGEGNDQRSKRS